MAKVIDLFARKPEQKKKRKNRHRRRVYRELLDECRQTGDPDVKLIDRICEDVCQNRLSSMDISAMYLYRKKSEG